MTTFSLGALVAATTPGTAPGKVGGGGMAPVGTGASTAVAGRAGCTAGGGVGGRCSDCQRSQRNSAEKEKMTNRIRRWVSMNQSESEKFSSLLKEPGRTRPDDTDDTERCGGPQATPPWLRHGAR